MNLISFALLGRIFGIAGKKLGEWYRDHLSDFKNPKTQKALHSNDTVDPGLIDRKTGKLKVVHVPILRPENFGEDMALDDKNIDGEGYTILSNKKTGKIALLASTTKTAILAGILGKLPATMLFSVKTVSRDLAESYDWLTRTVFMNAMAVADKFHVVKLGLEALQDVRIRYRQEILRAERMKREKWKKTGKSRPPPASHPHRHANGETAKEILARSRYLLFSFESEWGDSQRERAAILFAEFPELGKAYKLICGFRAFYRMKTGNPELARRKLSDWYAKMGTEDIEEMTNFASLVERHEGEILNYFVSGHTNAFAESLNSKIQACIRTSFGIRDLDFFHFRLRQQFS